MRCQINPFRAINCKYQRVAAELAYFRRLATARYQEYRFLLWDAVAKALWHNRRLQWRIEHLENLLRQKE